MFLGKFTSRKFLFPLTSALAIFLSDLLGFTLEPEAIYGIAIAALGYAGVEGMVDRKAIEASAEAMKGDTILAMQSMIDAYQRELVALGADDAPAAAVGDTNPYV